MLLLSSCRRRANTQRKQHTDSIVRVLFFYFPCVHHPWCRSILNCDTVNSLCNTKRFHLFFSFFAVITLLASFFHVFVFVSSVVCVDVWCEILKWNITTSRRLCLWLKCKSRVEKVALRTGASVGRDIIHRALYRVHFYEFNNGNSEVMTRYTDDE